MEKYSNSSNYGLENVPNLPLDEKILNYLKINGFNKSISEMYKACIGDKYNSSDVQKRRLISYLIIKKNKLTIDLVLKRDGRKTDHKTKSNIFKNYVDRGLITISSVGSFSYVGSMKQNLEILHLLVQESFFDGDIGNKQVVKKETENKLSYLKNDIVIKNFKKDNSRENLSPDNFQDKIVQTSTENYIGESVGLTYNNDNFTKLQYDGFNSKPMNAKFEQDGLPLSKFDLQNVNISSIKIDEINNTSENMNINWSIDPKKVKLRPNFSKEEMFGKCSKMARLYLESLKIKRENILIGNSIDLIRMLRKTKTGTEYKADTLTGELLSRAKEGKGNMYDVYFITPKGHRVIVFIGTDSELYVLDPYYAGNKPVKIMNYFLSKTRKGYRSVMVPDKDGYIIEDSQLLPKKKSSK